MVFACLIIYPRICFGICHAICPKICHAEKNIKEVMVSRNLRKAHLLEVNLTKIMGDNETLSIIHHIGLQVDFSSMKSSLDL